MKVKVLNSSSRRTRHQLRIAFAQLLQEKKIIKKITVSELVERAGVTRATFYTHYDNIYEITKEIQNEILEVLFEDFDLLNSKAALEKKLNIIFEHLKLNEEIYKIILSSDEPLIFINRLNRLMTSNLNKYISKNNCKSNQLDINFFVDGVTSMVIKYFRGDIVSDLDSLKIYIINIYDRIFL